MKILEKTPELKDCYTIAIAQQSDDKVLLSATLDNITPFNTKDGYCGFCINAHDLSKLKIIACGKGWDFHAITHNNKVLFHKPKQWFLISTKGVIQLLSASDVGDIMNGKDI